MPAKIKRLSIGVRDRHPITVRKAWLMGLSIRQVWALRHQTSAQYLAVKWTEARVTVRSIAASTPQLDPDNCLKSSMQDVNFFRIDSKCRKNMSALFTVDLYQDKAIQQVRCGVNLQRTKRVFSLKNLSIFKLGQVGRRKNSILWHRFKSTFKNTINLVLSQVYFLQGLMQGRPTFFDPRAIWVHQKYWWAKQIKHTNFCSKIVAISKKRSSI